MSSYKFKNVMIIDDNNIDLYITGRMIQLSGFGENVLTYGSAEAALHYLQENKYCTDKLPQIMFVDIYMPIMSGFEFMRSFDNLPPEVKSKIRVFIVSSSIDESDIEKARQDPNVVAFKEKPISKEFLETLH